MRSQAWFKRAAQAALAVAAVALLAAGAMPHRHEEPPASHFASSCRACKIQEAFSADAPTQVTLVEAFRVAFESAVLSVDVPRAKEVVSALASRAPPQHS